jgi:hypothetical protein
VIVTRCTAASRVTRSKTPRSCNTSSSRPTNAASVDRITSAPSRARGAPARHNLSGSVLPFTDTASNGSNSNTRDVAAYVASPTATPPTGAADWIRAAVFTASPVTNPSPSSGRALRATTTSPVLTPTRTDRSITADALSSRIADRIANPARTARSASSSWATGAPKTAITASPTNFSTVPPKLSIRSRNSA